MSRACDVCLHANRDAIEARLIAGDTVRAVASAFMLGRNTVDRHQRNHMGRRMREHVQAASDAPRPQDAPPQAVPAADDVDPFSDLPAPRDDSRPGSRIVNLPAAWAPAPPPARVEVGPAGNGTISEAEVYAELEEVLRKMREDHERAGDNLAASGALGGKRFDMLRGMLAELRQGAAIKPLEERGLVWYRRRDVDSEVARLTVALDRYILPERRDEVAQAIRGAIEEAVCTSSS